MLAFLSFLTLGLNLFLFTTSSPIECVVWLHVHFIESHICETNI